MQGQLRPVEVESTDGRPFKIRFVLPEECLEQPSPEAPQTTPFRTFAYFGPGAGLIDASGFFTVLVREANPGDLVEIDLERRGEEILSRVDVDGRMGGTSEVLSRSRSGPEAEIRHTRVVRDRDRIFGLSVRCREEHFSHIDCPAIIRSLTLVDPPSGDCCEHLSVHRASGWAPFSVQCPASWRRAPLPNVESSSSTPDLQLTAQDANSATGLIELRVLPATTGPVHRLIQEQAHGLELRGVRLRGAPILEVDPPPGFEQGYVYGPSATCGGVAITATCLVLRQGEIVAVVQLLGPDRTSAPINWAVNRRAADIVVSTLNIDL